MDPKYILVLFPTWEDLPIYCFVTFTLCLKLCLNVISTESALLRPSTILISLLHLSTTYICFWSVFVFWFCCYTCFLSSQEYELSSVGIDCFQHRYIVGTNKYLLNKLMKIWRDNSMLFYFPEGMTLILLALISEMTNLLFFTFPYS